MSAGPRVFCERGTRRGGISSPAVQTGLDTKVNRCLTEGRRAFLDRLAGIESGAECERLEPLLSALADGEAGADELSALRPHLRTCLACRARLREFRSVPARVAALAPPAAVAAIDPGPVRGLLESVLGATQERAAALGERAAALGDRAAALGDRFGHVAELATGQKVAAVAASAAVIAGGGAVGVERFGERATAGEAPPAAEAPAPDRAVADPAPPPPPASAPDTSGGDGGPAPGPRAASPKRPVPSPAQEFAPEAAGASPAPRLTPAPVTREFAPGGGGGSGRGGEFSP